MKAGYTLAWAEGTHLTQQHFQYWDSVLHETQWAWVKSFVPYAYGLISCEWDEEAIRHGICRLKQCRYLTQSGHLIMYDSETMPAVECELAQHAGNFIYMQWAQNKKCLGLSGYETETSIAQYQVSYQKIKDEHDAEREQEVALKRYHIVLSQQAHPNEGAFCVPIARIEHQVGSHYVFDTRFVPSAMCLNAAPGLHALLQRVMTHMADVSLLMKRQLDKKWDAKTYIDYIQLSHVRMSLNMIHRHRTAHPHQLYEKLAKLMYQLHGAWPEYHHDQLTETFHQIETQLTTLWTVNTLPEEDKVMLIQTDPHHYSTGHVSAEIIHMCDWYLGVSVADEELSWIRQFVQQVKLATPDTLPSVLMSALPGIALQHVQRPPDSVTLKSGYEYFRLKKQDVYWDSLVMHQNLLVYLPKPFHQATLTLDIVKE